MQAQELKHSRFSLSFYVPNKLLEAKEIDNVCLYNKGLLLTQKF